MRKVFCHLLIALLTFSVGVVGAFSYRDYQSRRAQLMWNESRLRLDLFYIRQSIDEYAADKGELPQSMDDLVKTEHLRTVPYDAVARRRAWKIIVGDDPNSLKGNRGIVDVRSTSSAISSQGTPYNEW